MKLFEGKCGTSVKVLCDSVSQVGARFTTMEITYPRIILAELNTHRMLSKNSASSRAIPFKKMVENLGGGPVRFGKAQAGMQDAGEHEGFVHDMLRGQMLVSPQEAWDSAKIFAIQQSESFVNAGYAKQIYNRLTEPFQIMKTVISATEWDNFFWLRNDKAADPTLHELARLMHEAKEESIPQLLEAGEWHLPYVEFFRNDSNEAMYAIRDEDNTLNFIAQEDAIKVSCARCAAVSFRNIDYGVEKSREVYARLVGDERKHASAFEHCGTPMMQTEYGVHLEADGLRIRKYKDLSTSINVPQEPVTWEEGITHMDRSRQLWSGNLKGFIQYRKLIPGENYVNEN